MRSARGRTVAGVAVLVIVAVACSGSSAPTGSSLPAPTLTATPLPAAPDEGGADEDFEDPWASIPEDHPFNGMYLPLPGPGEVAASHGDVSVVARVIDEEPDDIRVDIYALYPEVVGAAGAAAINLELATFATEHAERARTYATDDADFIDETWMDLDYMGETWFEVLHLDERLLVLTQSTWIFTGGAHGHGVTSAVTYDLESGERLDPDAWLRDGWRDELRPLVEEGLHDLDIGYANRGSVLSTRDLIDVVPTIGGVHVQFQEYQFSPYSEGRPVVLLSWPDVADWVVADSPVARLVSFEAV